MIRSCSNCKTLALTHNSRVKEPVGTSRAYKSLVVIDLVLCLVLLRSLVCKQRVGCWHGGRWGALNRCRTNQGQPTASLGFSSLPSWNYIGFSGALPRNRKFCTLQDSTVVELLHGSSHGLYFHHGSRETFIQNEMTLLLIVSETSRKYNLQDCEYFILLVIYFLIRPTLCLDFMLELCLGSPCSFKSF